MAFACVATVDVSLGMAITLRVQAPIIIYLPKTRTIITTDPNPNPIT